MAQIIKKGYDFGDVLIIPRYNRVLSRRDVCFETQVTYNYKIKIPLISANMDSITDSAMAIEIGKLGGLGVIHRFMDIKKQSEEVKKVKKEKLLCAASIGIKDFRERSDALIKAKVDIIVIDVAHSHSRYIKGPLRYIKENYPNIDVIVGNIVTKDAAEFCLSNNVDAVKVGVGPGKVCTTRDMTGVGVPQLTAIMEVFEALQGKIPIIADGGIRCPGDAVKALGAGANTIMCGYIFAGCDETPKLNNDEKRIYRGSASRGVKKETAFIEGKEMEVDAKGPVENVVKKYLDGLASGLTYCGKNQLKDFIGKVDFVSIK